MNHGLSKGTYLAIVECALNSQVVHIGIQDSSHLSLLNWANSALWMKDEDGNILLAAETVDSSGSSITTCSSNNGKMMSVLARLAHVSSHQEVLEEVTKQLESNILESECRAVEQLKQVKAVLLIEGDKWGGIWMAESGITSVNDVLEVCTWDFGVGNVEREEFEGKIGEGEVAPFRFPIGWDLWDFFWDEKTTVLCETLEDDFLEGELYGISGGPKDINWPFLRRMSLL
jgi:hypothetical protein